MGSMTAPTAVGMPSSGSTLVAGMTMYSANAPSRSTPMIRVLRQMWALPVRHCRQCPHTMCPSAVTSWPALSSPTPSPTATTSPANSCPMTSGGLRRPWAQASHSAMCRSVPHTPAWRTAMSTSPGPAAGFGTVATLRPGPGQSFTMACMAGIREAERGGSEDGAREAPVHLDHDARDVAGAFGGQEHDGRSQLVGAAHASHRNVCDHLAHHFLGAAVLPLRPRLVELHGAVERVARLVAERRGGRAAGVAEQDVEPAQLTGDPLHHPLRLGGDPDVRHQRHDGAGRLGLELLRHALDGVLMTSVDGDARPLLRQGLRHGAAQAFRAAAHQRHAAGETEVHRRRNLEAKAKPG